MGSVDYSGAVSAGEGLRQPEGRQRIRLVATLLAERYRPAVALSRGREIYLTVRPLSRQETEVLK